MDDLNNGRDLLFVAGGIGLAPLRSVINGCLDTPGHGKITILYGSRVPSDIAFRADIDAWQNHPAVDCRLTVDVAEPGWDGPVGLVTGLLEQLTVNPATSTALVCGPPVMIAAVLNALGDMGFADEDILTTMERHMKCGIGVCRHCHLDSKLVCVDGPVFSRAQLKKLQVDSL
jgi:NAD(P)H-flavin reductase